MADEIYEMYGRLVEEKQQIGNAYVTTLNMLRQLKAGGFSLDQLEVFADGWTVHPLGSLNAAGD